MNHSDKFVNRFEQFMKKDESREQFTHKSDISAMSYKQVKYFI